MVAVAGTCYPRRHTGVGEEGVVFCRLVEAAHTLTN